MPSTWNPTKQSPVHHKLVESGAVLAQVSGWLLAEHFGNAQEELLAVRSSVGLADLSWVSKWEIQGTEVRRFLTSILGEKIPEPGRAALVSSGYACRGSRNHALFVSDQETAPFTARPSAWGSNAGCLHATDRTNGFGSFVLCGPRARAVLSKLTSLDLRERFFTDLSCAWGPMAAIRVLLVRKDRSGVPGYEIFFSREYGEYLWDAVKEAGMEFHLRPFGLAAARILEH